MSSNLKLFSILLFSVMSMLAIKVFAQAHIHGQGELLIAQEGTNWHISLVVPAGDILGFEHSPETEEQRQAINKLAGKLETNEKVFALNDECSLDKVNHNLKTQGEHHHDGEHGHHDVEVEYNFTCNSASIELSITLFDWITSIEKIQAQWVVQGGQGQKTLTPNQPTLELNK